MRNPDLLALIRAFDEAWNSRHAETILSWFTPDAMVRLEPALAGERSIHAGAEQVRTWVQALVAEKCGVESRHHHLLDNEVIWLMRLSADRFRRLGADPVECTGEAAFEGDKIKSLIVTVSATSLARLQQALAA
jgi:hypothetical protein